MKYSFEQQDYSFLDEKLEQDYRQDQKLSQELFSFLLQDMANRKNGNIAPDTTGADKFFLDGFITPDMEYEFWAIARDFLKHHFGKAREFDSLAWYDNSDPCMTNPDQSMQLTVLNVIYNAAKAGDPYSVELVRQLYKIFHRKEYQSLKRFRKISVDEIYSLAEEEDGECSYDSIGRILGMCRFLKIDLDEGCSILYMILDKRRREFDEEDEAEREFLEFKEGLFQDCVAQVDEWIGHGSEDKKTRNAMLIKHLEKYWTIEEFVGNCFRYNGFPLDYHYRCDSYNEDVNMRLARTLAILRTTYPKREFGLDEVLAYAHIFSLVSVVVDVSTNMYDNFAQMLGVEDDRAVVDGEPMRFQPERIIYTDRKNEEVLKSKPVNMAPVGLGEAKDAEYIEEIANLRSRLSEKESEIKHLRGQYDAVRRELSERTAELTKYANDRDELVALREYLYGLSEEDLDNSREHTDTARLEIENHAVFIIGGHTNWVNKMKELFPKWRFIGNDSFRTVDDKVLDGAERVYFFTDYMSHVLYGKFMNLVRAKGIPFGYIHSTNIDAAIRGIYKDFQV